MSVLQELKGIDYAPFTLQFLSVPNSKSISSIKQGCLLRIHWKDLGTTYSVLDPWEVFHDEPLPIQLSKLIKNEFTILSKQSILNSRLPFMELEVSPKSHKLFQNFSYFFPDPDHTHIKIKVTSPDVLLKLMKERLSDLKPYHLRFDFNLHPSPQAVIAFIDEVLSLGLNIDFIEDPFEDENYLKDLKAPFFSDFKSYKNPSGYVLKPALLSLETMSSRMLEKPNSIVTTYMSHPLEQWISSYLANKLASTAIHGLLTHEILLETPYHQALSKNGACVSFQKSLFLKLLEQETWLKLH